MSSGLVLAGRRLIPRALRSLSLTTCSWDILFFFPHLTTRRRTIGTVCLWVSFVVHHLTPRVCLSGKLHFLLQFSGKELIANCIASGVVGVQRIGDREFFYLFVHISPVGLENTKNIRKGGAAANTRRRHIQAQERWTRETPHSRHTVKKTMRGKATMLLNSLSVY